jgi:NTE family protein
MTDTNSGNQQSNDRPYVVLALQGGGALGAFQAGAYQALSEKGYEPNWAAGISIGAVNASIIAGNEQKDRLHRLLDFWRMVGGNLGWWECVPTYSEKFTNLWKLWMSVAGGVPGFFRPNFILPPFAPYNSPQASSLYNVQRLRTTLQKLINFDFLSDYKSPEHVRLSLGATRVFGGVTEVFQSFHCPEPRELNCRHTVISIDHILASGANAPWFPGVVINNQPYWDGGLTSNTAVRQIIPQLKHLAQTDIGDKPVVIFAIDLWEVHDRAPKTFEEVCWRIKQIEYSNRLQNDVIYGKHFLDRERLYAENQDLRNGHASRWTRPIDIVRVSYRCDPSDIPYGDGLFSRTEIERRMADGYAAVLSVFEQEPLPWQRQGSDDTEAKIHSF